MLTPEGKVKAAIKSVLDPLAPDLWYVMTVPYGYGKSTLDFMGWYKGRAFAVEAKAPGGTPTARQRLTIQQMREAGADVFEIDGPVGLEELRTWLAWAGGQ